MNKYQRQRARQIRQIMRRDKWGKVTYQQARSLWERTIGPNRYREIVNLYIFCQKIRLCSVLQPFLNGYAIRFPRSKFGGDFVQHYGSYGAMAGCVEPAIGCNADYTAVSLENAKALVLKHKDRLNGGAGNAE